MSKRKASGKKSKTHKTRSKSPEASSSSKGKTRAASKSPPKKVDLPRKRGAPDETGETKGEQRKAVMKTTYPPGEKKKIVKGEDTDKNNGKTTKKANGLKELPVNGDVNEEPKKEGEDKMKTSKSSKKNHKKIADHKQSIEVQEEKPSKSHGKLNGKHHHHSKKHKKSPTEEVAAETKSKEITEKAEKSKKSDKTSGRTEKHDKKNKKSKKRKVPEEDKEEGIKVTKASERKGGEKIESSRAIENSGVKKRKKVNERESAGESESEKESIGTSSSKSKEKGDKTYSAGIPKQPIEKQPPKINPATDDSEMLVVKSPAKSGGRKGGKKEKAYRGDSSSHSSPISEGSGIIKDPKDSDFSLEKNCKEVRESSIDTLSVSLGESETYEGQTRSPKVRGKTAAVEPTQGYQGRERRKAAPKDMHEIDDEAFDFNSEAEEMAQEGGDEGSIFDETENHPKKKGVKGSKVKETKPLKNIAPRESKPLKNIAPRESKPLKNIAHKESKEAPESTHPHNESSSKHSDKDKDKRVNREKKEKDAEGIKEKEMVSPEVMSPEVVSPDVVSPEVVSPEVLEEESAHSVEEDKEEKESDYSESEKESSSDYSEEKGKQKKNVSHGSHGSPGSHGSHGSPKVQGKKEGRKVYDEEFKKMAVRECLEIGNKSAAERLGLCTRTLSTWKQLFTDKQLQVNKDKSKSKGSHHHSHEHHSHHSKEQLQKPSESSTHIHAPPHKSSNTHTHTHTPKCQGPKNASSSTTPSKEATERIEKLRSRLPQQNKSKKPTYDYKFKVETVKEILRSGISPENLAKQLGLSGRTLHEWRKVNRIQAEKELREEENKAKASDKSDTGEEEFLLTSDPEEEEGVGDQHREIKGDQPVMSQPIIHTSQHPPIPCPQDPTTLLLDTGNKQEIGGLSPKHIEEGGDAEAGDINIKDTNIIDRNIEDRNIEGNIEGNIKESEEAKDVDIGDKVEGDVERITPMEDIPIPPAKEKEDVEEVPKPVEEVEPREDGEEEGEEEISQKESIRVSLELDKDKDKDKESPSKDLPPSDDLPVKEDEKEVGERKSNVDIKEGEGEITETPKILDTQSPTKSLTGAPPPPACPEEIPPPPPKKTYVIPRAIVLSSPGMTNPQQHTLEELKRPLESITGGNGGSSHKQLTLPRGKKGVKKKEDPLDSESSEQREEDSFESEMEDGEFEEQDYDEEDGDGDGESSDDDFIIQKQGAVKEYALQGGRGGAGGPGGPVDVPRGRGGRGSRGSRGARGSRGSSRGGSRGRGARGRGGNNIKMAALEGGGDSLDDDDDDDEDDDEDSGDYGIMAPGAQDMDDMD